MTEQEKKQLAAVIAPGGPSPLAPDVASRMLADSFARLGVHENAVVQFSAAMTVACRALAMLSHVDKAAAAKFVAQASAEMKSAVLGPVEAKKPAAQPATRRARRAKK